MDVYTGNPKLRAGREPPAHRNKGADGAADSVAQAPLQIRLFGPLDVRVGGEPLPRLRGRTGSWLLALLALRAGRTVQRDWLAGTLWPESAPEQAAYNLRRALSDLRAALGPEAGRIGSPNARSLRLEPQGADIDAAAFDAAVGRAGDPASLETAVALYRGPLLEGCSEDWATAERTERAEKFLAALEALARLRTEAGDHAGAASLLRLALAHEPAREGTVRALMSALMAAQSYAAVLEAYRDLRRALHALFPTARPPVEPAADTAALYEEAKRLAAAAAGSLVEKPAQGVPAPPPTPPAPAAPAAPALPRPRTRFIGRDEECRGVLARLAEAPLVTLTGPGGVGKTRLALEIAAVAGPHFPGGVFFVALAPLADPGHVAAAVAAAVGVNLETPGRTPLAAAAEALAARTAAAPGRALLVLDNCEHLLPAAAGAADGLLAACPALGILATSREPLLLDGEARWPVAPLAAPPADPRGAAEAEADPARLASSPAVALFVDRARAALPGFALTPENGARVASLCRRLDGLPLAIELAAAKVDVLPLAEMEARLFRVLRSEEGHPEAVPRRHRTVEALIDWGYDLLAPREQRLLARLSVFAGGWTLEAAEEVCAGDGVDADDVFDGLLRLSRASLVESEDAPPPAGRRHRLLELVREYASRRLAESPAEARATEARHAAYSQRLAERANAAVASGPEWRAWLDRLDAERDNLRAALGRVSVPAGDRVRLAASLRRFWVARGHITEGRAALGALLDGTDALTPAERAAALHEAGTLAKEQGDSPLARAMLEEALAIRRGLGDRGGEAATRNNLAFLLRGRGDYEGARAHLEAALAEWREVGVDADVATALRNLGNVAHDQGDLAAAEAAYAESLALFQHMGDEERAAYLLVALGSTLERRGDPAGARERHREALTTFTRLGHLPGQTSVLLNIGSASLALHEPDAAEQALRECLALQGRLGERRNIHHTLHFLGACAALRGEWASAARLYGAAQAARDRIGAALDSYEGSRWGSDVAAVRATLGESGFHAAWAAGRADGVPDLEKT